MRTFDLTPIVSLINASVAKLNVILFPFQESETTQNIKMLWNHYELEERPEQRLNILKQINYLNEQKKEEKERMRR